jgi:predicted RND superfamily exporter protein
MSWLLSWASWLVINRPWTVVLSAVLLTVLLCSNIPNLQLKTNLLDLFGEDSPQWQAADEFNQELGYANQLFVILETADNEEQAANRMEELADQLVEEMLESPYFKSARCSLGEEEILGLVQLFTSNFPSFIDRKDWSELKRKLSEEEIKSTVQRGSLQLITPFSTLGTNYFLADPLGLAELTPLAKGNVTEYMGFDLAWGSSAYFFSKDHRALLVVAEPTEPAVNYQFAERVVGWTRDRAAALLDRPEFGEAEVRFTLAGSYLYVEQDHAFIEENIQLVSWVALVGILILCILAYKRITLFLLAFLPTVLGILWTTGVVSYYPGELNLITLSFIAILVGLGDDHIVHFFNRVPQEWRACNTLEEAMTRTFRTTGRSVIVCLMTTLTATVALAISSFKGLAEFGFFLSVGLLMLLVHTLLTVPALMCLVWRVFPPSSPDQMLFRFLPAVTKPIVTIVGKLPRFVLTVALVVFLVAVALLPSLRMDRNIKINREDDNPALVGQRRLAERFGIETAPELLLIQGTEGEILEQAEGLVSGLEPLKERGILRSVFSPSLFVPSPKTQTERFEILEELDLKSSAEALRNALVETGLRVALFQPVIDRLLELDRSGARPVTLEEVSHLVPLGMLDSSIRRIEEDRYLAVIAVHASDPEAVDVIPRTELEALRERFGPFTELSFAQINRDLQTLIFRDSRQALMITLIGILIIVYVCFGRVFETLLVLTPVVFATVTTFGLLILLKHPFSYMALVALPLIIGIGIDNGVHLVKRYVEGGQRDIIEITKSSAPALILSNLTTVIGFGALMLSEFEALAELGLVTAIGVGMALAGALWVIPAACLVFGMRGVGNTPPRWGRR